MSRVINTNSPGKVRNQMMRTAAELLRRLSQKTDVDADAKDMAAMLVFCLREIEDGIDASAEAWEKRDYWIKAEQLRQRWAWTRKAAGELEAIVRHDAWEKLPVVMADLLPYFADIKVTKFTRDPSVWHGAFDRLREKLGL